jgi:hypothetical protein
MKYRAILFVALILFIAQALVQGIAVWLEWSWTVRGIILWVTLGLDLVFVVDFLLCLYLGMIRRRGLTYLTEERGWADFLGSVGPLVLHSLPLSFGIIAGNAAVLSGQGAALLRHVVAVAALLRVLRLLKLLTVFGYPRAPMAHRHVSRVAANTVGVGVLLVALMVFGSSVASGPGSTPRDRMSRLLGYMNSVVPEEPQQASEALTMIGQAHPEVLAVERGDQRLYARQDLAANGGRLGPNDYGFLERDGLELFFDLRPVRIRYAAAELATLIVGLIVLVVLIAGYGRHLSRTVSDPLQVMEQGLSHKGFDLSVKVPSRYRDDEVYRLAALYNSTVLPVKDRFLRAENTGMSDFGDSGDSGDSTSQPGE